VDGRGVEERLDLLGGGEAIEHRELAAGEPQVLAAREALPRRRPCGRMPVAVSPGFGLAHAHSLHPACSSYRLQPLFAIQSETINTGLRMTLQPGPGVGTQTRRGPAGVATSVACPLTP